MIKPSLLLLLALLGASADDFASSRVPTLEAAQPYRTLVPSDDRLSCSTRLGGELLMRTELVFGLSRASGADITETEFQRFIAARVTPRFPDGLTVLNGNGQFKDASGTIVQERSKLLILLYPFSTARHERVEEIRAEYKGMFQQQAVLRVDAQMCASF